MGLGGNINDISSNPILLLVASLATFFSYLLQQLGLVTSPGLVVLDQQLSRILHDVEEGGGGDDDDCGEGEEVKCTVCLCSVRGREEVSKLACSHFFHRDCLDGWLMRQNMNCPLCRTVVASGRQTGELVEWF